MLVCHLYFIPGANHSYSSPTESNLWVNSHQLKQDIYCNSRQRLLQASRNNTYMIGLYHKCGQWMTFFIFWTFITWMIWTFIYHPFWTILTPVRRAIEADFKITIFIRKLYSLEMDPSNPQLGTIKLWTFDFACNCNGRFDWGHVSYLDKHRLHHFWVPTWQIVCPP